jgi:enamine deaminase RidA (YjgF/YER057c/UK114 family)
MKQDKQRPTIHRVLQPEGWARPRGYVNGMEAVGRQVYVAGLIGWNAQCEFETDDFLGQYKQTLENTIAVLKEAGAGPEHITRMTWYITSREEYNEATKGMGAIWKDIMGFNYPPMACVIVAGLMEERAKIEMETTAVVPFETDEGI